jgi:Tfp pilus assembly protein PilF
VRCLVLILLALAANTQELTEQIRAAQSAGNYADAAALYAHLIASGSDAPEIRSNYGVMLHLAGKNSEAMAQFRMALERKPSLAGANLFAGLTEIDLGAPKLALSYLTRALEADPSQPAPLLGLAKAHVALRKYAAANDSYRKAAALDPKLAEPWYGLGVTDRSLAEELLSQAARDGQSTDAQRERVQALLADALKALTRALELEPDSARTHLVMAESLSDAGKITEAIGEYQTALKLDPQLVAASLGLASLYWKQRQFEHVLPLLQHVLQKSPRDPEANGMMADIEQHAGKDAEAEQYATVALAGNPDLIETRVVLARVYVARQQPKLAIAELKKVITADPDGSYHFLLYRAYRQTGDERSAKLALARFQQLRKGTAQP